MKCQILYQELTLLYRPRALLKLEKKYKFES